MFGISEAAEAALAYLVLHQDEGGVSTNDELLVKGILALRRTGMASAQTDWGEQAIFIANLEAAGYEHFGRAHRLRKMFCPLSEAAEELALELYAHYMAQR